MATTVPAQKVTISGYVRDLGSKEVLAGASVINMRSKSGTTTNDYGFYSLTTPWSDTVELVISYNGYDIQAKKIAPSATIKLDILLEPKVNPLKEVVVRAGGSRKNINRAEMGVIDLPVTAIKSLPVLLGERDVLKIIQLLPGVQAGQEGTTGFYVRGGNLDQNLVQLDEATVYNPNHLFGLFSTFNVNAINHVQLIKGGFPAEYGGRLSSILNISMKEGNKTKYESDGGFGLLAANRSIEGPIQKNKSSFILSGRISYVNLFIKPFFSNSTRYSFYDVNGKMNYEIGKKDHLFLSFFKGNDNASYTGANSLNYGTDFGNTTGTLRWNHLFGNKVFSNTSLIYNDYHLSLGTTQNNYYALLFTGINDVNAKTDFTYFPNAKHTIKAGFNYTYHTLYPAATSAKTSRKGNQLQINKDSIAKRFSNEYALYASDAWEIVKALGINYGIRIPFYTSGGKAYAFIEPRITTRISINNSTSVKLSFTVMDQFVHLVPNSTASLPTDIWLSSSATIKPQNSNQFALGIFKNFKDNSIEASIEGYYKTMNNQVLFKEGTQIVLTTNLDSALTFGNGNSYGVEFFLRKNFGRFSGWASYTWSKTMQQFAELNYGKSFPSSFDRRHNISLTGIYNLTKRWTLSSDFVFYTGRPFTLPAGRVTVPVNATLYDGSYYDFSSRNNTRLRNYHRLDLSASYKKQRKLFGFTYDSEWVFGAYNIYSRLNPYFVYLATNPDTRMPEARQVSLLPIIPSVTFNAKF